MKAKTRLHRLLSILLCIVMMMSVMSTTVLADYADGMDCLACGHYHWDANVCGMCGLCSPECSTSCWEEFHCQYGCGACYLEVDYWCPECGLCEDCMEDTDFHCKECRACLQPDDLCQTCFKCENCVGWLCMDCGQCDECSDDFHCEECGGCYAANGWNHGTHCADCCEFCEQCGECIIENETETCFECGLCVECCEANRYDSDCTCYEYCVASVEFEEHFCEQCGTCFGEVEQCETCYLCVDCCADNSECSEGMCVEDSDYEEHFCDDCGTCFHDAELCETCAEAGELRCVYCCEALAESYGCDCGDMCASDPEFEDHLQEAHSDGESGEHTPRAKSAWAMDAENHWHECRYCDEHILDKAAHSFDENYTCTVCGYRCGEKVVITGQPRDAYAKVSDPNPDDDNDPLNRINNQVSFQVSAYSVSMEGRSELHYQWYQVRNDTHTKLADKEGLISGAKTNKLTVYVPTDACCETYEYYCMITDDNHNLSRSEKAELHAAHVCDLCLNVPETETITRFYRQNGSGYEIIDLEDTLGHEWRCHSYSDGCDKVKNRNPVGHRSDGAPVKVQGTYLPGNAEAGKFKEYYQYTCADCGYRRFVEKHEHKFECVVPAVGSPDRADFEAACVGLTHPLVCTVEGCGETRTEVHKWSKEIVGWPGAAGSEKGALHLVCTVCEYWIDGTWEDEDGNDVYWTANNMLVTADYGYVNRSLAEPGDTLKLTPERRAEEGNYQKCTGWTARYTYWDTGTGMTKTQAVTLTVTDNGDGTWSCTLPATFAAMGVPGGGHLIFTAQFAACDHSGGTRLEGYREPVCLRSGYSGDTVCADCGKVIETGDPISGTGAHEGPIKPIDGTAVDGSCTVKGYEGDSKCEKCGLTFKGKTTGYVHANQEVVNAKEATCTQDGYTGDTVCADCGKILKHGTVIRAKHLGEGEIKNAKDATCTETGYTGDTVCEVCGEVMKNGRTTPVLGHDWDEGTVTTAATAYDRGEITYTCTRAGCGATKIEYFDRLIPIGKVDVTVTAPVRGAEPEYAAEASTERCTVAAVDWDPMDDVFLPGTVYTVKVTLEAAAGCGFSIESFTINGSAATVVSKSDESVVLTYAFPRTDWGVHHLNFTLTFDTNGGSALESVSALGGTRIDLADYTPVRAGYVFAGWYADAALTEAVTSVELLKDTTVYAKWTEAEFPFTDVKTDDWFRGDVEYVYNKGLMDGTGDTTFSPYLSTTRGMIVTILYRLEGCPAVTGSNPFDDVADGKYYTDAVIWAAENGIVEGYRDDEFRPEENITREQLAAVLYRYARFKGVDVSVGEDTNILDFSDAETVSDWAVPAMQWACGAGLIEGSGGKLMPRDEATRAQVAAILHRFCENLDK